MHDANCITSFLLFSAGSKSSKSAKTPKQKTSPKPIENIKKEFFQKLQTNQMLSLDNSSENDTMGPDLPMLDPDLMSKCFDVRTVPKRMRLVHEKSIFRPKFLFNKIKHYPTRQIFNHFKICDKMLLNRIFVRK